MIKELKMYKRFSDKNYDYFLLFTLLFAVSYLVSQIWLVSAGKSLVYGDDALSIYYEILQYRKSLFQNFVTDLFHNGTFAIPWNNYNLSQNDNLFCLMGLEIFDIPLLFADKSKFEFLFSFMMVLRLYFAGIAFSLYCFRMNNPKRYALFGALLYTFSGYAICVSLKQPFFISMLYMTPVMFIGIENLLEKRKGGLFIGSVAATACISVYLMYYNTVVLGLYCCVRIFMTKTNVRMKFKNVLLLAVHYFLGIGISAFLFVPTVFGILSSNRMATSPKPENWFFYGISDSLEFVKGFFVGNSSAERWNFLGFSIIALFPILYLLAFGKKYRKLQVEFLGIILLMNLPFFGYLAGAGITVNRWSYILGFVVSYIVVKIIPLLLEIRDKQHVKIRNTLNSIAVLYFLLLLLWYFKSKEMVIVWELLLIVIMIFGMNVIWKTRISKNFSVSLLFGIEILSIMILGYSTYTKKYMEGFVDKGNANAQLESYVDAAASEIEDSDFYRVDKYAYEHEISLNLPYWYQYNGISSFFNLLNPYTYTYYIESENPGVIALNKISDLNGRITDESLACVKYYLVKKESVDRVPFGFRYLQDYSQNDEYAIYINDYSLPLGYTYDKAFAYNDFSLLNVAEKQEIMLKSIVLDAENSGEHLMEEERELSELKSQKMDIRIIDMEGVSMEGENWKVSENNAYIDIGIIPPVNGELYLELQGVENTGTSYCQIVVSEDEGNMYKAYSYSKAATRSTGQTEFAFNMGYGSGKEMKLRIAFSRKNLSIQNICAYIRPLDTYEEDIEKLKKESLEDIVFTTNQVDGNIEVSEEKFLCFSVPYSDGWTCYVDGVKNELMPANVMYMAIRLEPGRHHIRLLYRPKGFYIGVCLSAASIALIILCAVIRRKGFFKADAGRNSNEAKI